ncbi:hypothetical protein OPQ81_006626 [Rhizoctonia solani]|nr:hypothetical protein OPQ81_006626 [Rhizoctonia solani]
MDKGIPFGSFWIRLFTNKTITSRYALVTSDIPHPSTTILVPTGNILHQVWVETGTLLSVFLAFVYVAWCLLKYHRVASTKFKKS